jgi:hypothetical protein
MKLTIARIALLNHINAGRVRYCLLLPGTPAGSYLYGAKVTATVNALEKAGLCRLPANHRSYRGAAWELTDAGRAALEENQ